MASERSTMKYAGLTASIAVLAIIVAGPEVAAQFPDAGAPETGIAPGGSQPSAPAAVYTISRLDLARAYLEIDRALHEHPPASPSERARINTAFDCAAMMFFQRENTLALQSLHELTASILPPESRTADAKLLRALRVRIAPHVVWRDRPTPLRIKVSPFYALPGDRAAKLRLVIRPESPADAKPILEHDIELAPNGMAPATTIAQPDAPAGKYVVELVAPGGYTQPCGAWHVADESLEQARYRNEKRLRRVRPGSEQLSQAIVAVDARNRLLTDQLSETESAKYMTDPLQLAREVNEEIVQIDSDRDPFVDRRGDYWRTFALGNAQVPARVYAAAQVGNGQTVPLVIALHGAGAEEGMFMDGYGAGEIKRLADKHGFVVVAPSTYAVMAAPDQIDGLVRALKFNYPIDEKRVYVIGHSLGAMTAQSLTLRFGDKLAGAALLAGCAMFPDGRKIAPTIVFAAELDPITPIARLRAIASDAKRAGLPVEFREMKGYGHTLMVGDALPVAIEWMMSRPTGP